VKLYVAVRLSY